MDGWIKSVKKISEHVFPVEVYTDMNYWIGVSGQAAHTVSIR